MKHCIIAAALLVALTACSPEQAAFNEADLRFALTGDTSGWVKSAIAADQQLAQ